MGDAPRGIGIFPAEALRTLRVGVWRTTDPSSKALTTAEEAAHGVHAPTEDVLAKRRTGRRSEGSGGVGGMAWSGTRAATHGREIFRAGGQVVGVDLAF